MIPDLVFQPSFRIRFSSHDSGLDFFQIETLTLLKDVTSEVQFPGDSLYSINQISFCSINSFMHLSLVNLYRYFLSLF